MDVQAKALNDALGKSHPQLVTMLSERGKAIFFPKLGILSQSAQAKGVAINATIGEAREDNGSSMHLEEFDALLNVPVTDVFPYAPSYGKPELRTKWKEFIYQKNPGLKDASISLPIATNGLTQHGRILVYRSGRYLGAFRFVLGKLRSGFWLRLWCGGGNL